MSARLLGRTATPAAAIGQGTFGLGGAFARDGSRDRECLRALRLGIDLGLRLIDTAPVYGAGHAEELVGEAVRGVRESVLVATKFSPEDSDPAGVVRSAEASLRRLGTDRIDILQVHWPNAAVPLEATLEAMLGLVRAGKVRFLGLGNCGAATVERALADEVAPHLVSVQQEYGLLERSVETALLPRCRAHGLTLLAYSPLARGALAPHDGRRAVLASVARRYDATIAQVILAWLTRDPAVVAIPKASSLAHVRENAAALELDLAAEDAALLADAFAVRTEAVPLEQIVVEADPERAVYTTLDEARENRFGLVPGPLDLAAELADGEMLKPIKVQAIEPGSGGPRFRLTEGRVRYWGWVIAHKDKPIPAIVEGADDARDGFGSSAEAR